MRITLTLAHLLFVSTIIGYGLPRINLGLSSFLDGGPLRPRPGWYYQQLFQYYDTDRFLDDQGKPLGGVCCSPHLRSFSTAAQVFYQFEQEFPFKRMRPGLSAALSASLYSHVTPNVLGLNTSGSGIGNLILGAYIQFDPLIYHDRGMFVHRIEFDTSFPVGKNKEPQKLINPASNFIFIDPYWAATLFWTEKWASSWRIYYLWCAENKKLCLKPGDAIHMNFSTEYWIRKNLWVGISGYFLQQIKDNKLLGIKVPNSRERVVGLGPGFLLLVFNRIDFVIIGNLYFEFNVRNRPRGTNAVLRFFKHFG